MRIVVEHMKHRAKKPDDAYYLDGSRFERHNSRMGMISIVLQASVFFRMHLQSARIAILYSVLWRGMGQAAAQERVQLSDGTHLNVFIVQPADTTDQPSPLLILMGGGPGNASISRDTSMWLGSGFAQRGWWVAVPVSPNNRAFRGIENNQKIDMLTEALQQRPDVAAGKTLLAGISNGGISALEIARRNPDNYLGVAAVPAISSSPFDNKPLAGFPVYLRIGGEDQLGWADRFDETVAAFTDAGVDLDAAILDSAPHMFRMNWESLDAWLQKVTTQ
jgi:predicted esterase